VVTFEVRWNDKANRWFVSAHVEDDYLFHSEKLVPGADLFAGSSSVLFAGKNLLFGAATSDLSTLAFPTANNLDSYTLGYLYE